jgi:nucleoside-diphosphate-sugar epimerase
MRILATGASGFIGTNLVEYYISKGVEIVNLDIASPKNAKHKPYWREVDILDSVALSRETVKFSPSHIINLAAQTGTTDRGKKLEDYATNFQGLRNLTDIARDIPSLERLISTSSMLVCRSGYQPQSETDYCPDTLYGRSKMLGEEVLQEAGNLPYSWIIVRPTGIWGPWFDIPYKTLFRLIQKGLYVHPGNSYPVQSLGFVGNTVYQLDKLIHASYEKVQGRVFYLADYPPTDMRTWVDFIQRAFKARRIHQLPIWVLKVMATVGDAVKLAGWDVPLLSSSRLRNMTTSFMVDLAPIIARKLPYTLEQAVEITVNWLSRNE